MHEIIDTWKQMLTSKGELIREIIPFEIHGQHGNLVSLFFTQIETLMIKILNVLICSFTEFVATNRNLWQEWIRTKKISMELKEHEFVRLFLIHTNILRSLFRTLDYNFFDSNHNFIRK
jgi:hypothetical protein